MQTFADIEDHAFDYYLMDTLVPDRSCSWCCLAFVHSIGRVTVQYRPKRSGDPFTDCL